MVPFRKNVAPVDGLAYQEGNEAQLSSLRQHKDSKKFYKYGAVKFQIVDSNLQLFTRQKRWTLREESLIN